MTGVSHAKLPRSTSRAIISDVSGLVIEPIMNSVAGVTGSLVPSSRTPRPFLEHDFAVLNDRERDARHLGLLARLLGEGEEFLGARGVERVRLPPARFSSVRAATSRLPIGDIELRPAPLRGATRAVDQA